VRGDLERGSFQRVSNDDQRRYQPRLGQWLGT
jgi:hypothetical protein